MLNSTLKNIQLRLLFFRYFSGGPSPALNAQICFLGESKIFEKFWAWGLVPAGGLLVLFGLLLNTKKGYPPTSPFSWDGGAGGTTKPGAKPTYPFFGVVGSFAGVVGVAAGVWNARIGGRP